MPNPAWTGLQDQYAKIFNAFPPSWNAALKKSIQNKSEKEFHALAESMPQIVWITNAEGLNIYFNQQWVTYTGQTLEESYGHGWIRPFHPDDQKLAWEAWENATQFRATYSLEVRLKRADGIYKWWLARGVPVLDTNGKVLKWFGTCTDIDQIKQTEAALRASSESYRLIVENITDYSIFLLDREGKVMSWSLGAEKMSGFKAAEIIGSSFSKFYLPEDVVAGKPDRVLRLALEKGYFADQGWRVRNDGSKFWANVKVSAILDDSKNLRGFLNITRDLTEQKEMEKKKINFLVQEKARAVAERANHIKDEFLATLSHELRTPLTIILSWAQMLRSGRLDAEKTKQGIEIIEKSAKSQGQLIDDLLDISAIQAGKLKLVLETIDPLKVVSACIDSVRSLATNKAIQIETEVDSSIKTICADPYRLQQIIWNLLTNAIKFSHQGGKVKILLKRLTLASGDQLQIQIQDYGKGIKSEFLSIIFERFSQADSSSTRLYKGLGLGLAIVQDLVEMHHGSISVTSQGENRGSTFTLCLPTKTEEKIGGPKIIKQSEDSVSATILQDVSVLVVEDEKSIREILEVILKSYGAKVAASESAQNALAILENFSPDVIVSDIAMPEEDGYSLIRKVRAMTSKLCSTPAIALTAYVGEDCAKHALTAGFQAHLAKPLDVNKLILTIYELHESTF
jgi:PAS domain S-box-containing protein